MKHSWFAASVARNVTLLLSALVLTAHPAQADEWMKYESSELTVYSDCPPYRAKSVAKKIAAYQFAVRTLMLPPGSVSPHTTLVVFNKTDEFDQYFQPTELKYAKLITLYVGKPIGRNRFIALADDSRIDERFKAITKLEATHMLPWMDDDPPQWLKYATEAVFSKFHLRGNLIDFDGANADQRSNLKKSEWRDWAVVVAGAKDEMMEKEKVPTNMAQSQCWLLGDWMLFGDTPRGTAYLKMLTAMRERYPSPRAAFEAGTGMNGAQLTDHLRKYYRDDAKRSLHFDANAFEASLRTSPANSRDLHLIRFHLLFGREPIDPVLNELRQAEASGPDCEELQFARVLGAKLANDRESVIRTCREAIAAGTRNAFFYLDSANYRLNHTSFEPSVVFGLRNVFYTSMNANASEVQAAFEEIRTGQQLDPLDPSIPSRLANVIMQLPSVTQEHVELLTPGLSDGPRGLHVRLVRGIVNQRLGANAKAETDFYYLLNYHPTSQQALHILELKRQQDETVVNAEVQKNMEQLFAQHRYAEARQIVAETLADEKNPNRQQALTKELKRLDEIIAWEETTSLAKKKRWAEVENTAKSYIERFPKSHRVQVIKNRLRTAQEQLGR
jgi:hypothetical protein